MSAIAIITARGGSKRIPKKNIKEFYGKPIISYSVEAAIKSGIFDEVMVSTDSEEIAKIALEYGASVPFMRSKKTSDDYATTEDVLLEVLERYKEQGMQYQIVCCIYPTAPFVTDQKLREAYELLVKNKNIDSVVPVVRYSFPPQRALVEKDGVLQYQYPEYATTRSQDLQPIYHDCGQFYICRTDALQEHMNLITPKSLPYVLPEEEVQDIDNISDWILAEQKYKNMIRDKVEVENKKNVSDV